MKKILSIGRDPSNDIVVNDYSDVVSRSHATLRLDGKKILITDHSTNGTYKNGIKLSPNVEYLVTKEDEISFGGAAYLDWSSIPRYKNGKIPLLAWLLPLIILAMCAIFAAIYFFVISPRKSCDVVPTAPVVEQKDTVSVENAEPKKKEKSEAEKKNQQKAKSSKQGTGKSTVKEQSLKEKELPKTLPTESGDIIL